MMNNLIILTLLIFTAITSAQNGCFNGTHSWMSGTLWGADVLSNVQADYTSGELRVTASQSGAIQIIPQGAFRGCSWVESVVFEGTVDILENAFKDCSNLLSVTFQAGGNFICEGTWCKRENFNPIAQML